MGSKKSESKRFYLGCWFGIFSPTSIKLVSCVDGVIKKERLNKAFFFYAVKYVLYYYSLVDSPPQSLDFSFLLLIVKSF